MLLAGQIAGFVILVGMVLAVLLRAYARTPSLQAADTYDRAMRVYRDQLQEVARDLERGTIPQAEAERLRLEISRRILDLDRAEGARAQGTLSPVMMRRIGVGAIAGSIVLGSVLYVAVGVPGYSDQPLAQRHADAAEARRNRPGQAELEARFASVFSEREDFEGRDTLEPMVEQLRAALQNRPDDVTGLRLLAQNEARLSNFQPAITAQLRVIELQGDNVATDDLAYLLDLMVIAAGGFVSPEADTLIERILRRDPQDQVALYYTGRMYAQTGRPDMTFRVWKRLHDLSPGDAPWMPEIRAALPELARISGEPRYQLPPRPAPADARGPSVDDIAAAQDMDPEARMAMIESMVDGLAARLANEGGAAEDWARLIQALGVLGRTDPARAVWGEAREVFASRPDELARITAAAQAAGLLAQD